MTDNTMDLLRGIRREVENEEMRFENILGRPISGTKLVDQLLKDRTPS